MVWCPSFQSSVRADGVREYRVGHELVDEFLEFASGRARPSTVRAYAHDLSVFFGVIRKEPKDVTSKDVLRFVTEQRRPRKGAEKDVYKRQQFVYVTGFSAHANLGFVEGASLPDPAGVLEGNGIRMRHVKFRTVDEVTGATWLEAYIRAALAQAGLNEDSGDAQSVICLLYTSRCV